MKTPKLLVLAYTSKTYHMECIDPIIKCDNPHLTRKLLCMDTWVSRLKNLGIETIFFDGDNSEVSFDEKNQTLHLIEDDSYDYDFGDNNISHMFYKLKYAIKWALENRDFDYILRLDDGTYVNAYIIEKFLSEFVNGREMVFSGFSSGGGMFISKKTCEELIKHSPKNDRIEDRIIYKILNEKQIYYIGNYSMLSSYNLGEENVTIHYATGKRMYYIDFVISNYYNNQKFPRKIIINNNFTESGREELNTNRVNAEKSNTPVWYGLDRDKNNWEYYGNYIRSEAEIRYNFYGNEVIEKLCLFYNHNYIKQLIEIDEYLSKFYRSIIPNGEILILLNTKNKDSINYVEENEFKIMLEKIKKANYNFEFLEEINYKKYLNAEYVDEDDIGTIIKIVKN